MSTGEIPTSDSQYLPSHRHQQLPKGDLVPQSNSSPRQTSAQSPSTVKQATPCRWSRTINKTLQQPIKKDRKIRQKKKGGALMVNVIVKSSAPCSSSDALVKKHLREFAVTDLEHSLPLAHPSYCYHGSDSDFTKVNWRSTKLVLLSGAAGTGKTTLAQTIIRDLTQYQADSNPNGVPCPTIPCPHAPGDPSSALCLKTMTGESKVVHCATIYFECSSEDPSSVMCLTIANQWAHDDDAYIDSVLSFGINVKKIESILEAQFPAYIREPGSPSTPPPFYLVFIDGLERCHEPRTQARIMKLVIDQIKTHPTSPLRWLITSHLDETLDQKLEVAGVRKHTLSEDSRNVPDFIKSSFNKIFGDDYEGVVLQRIIDKFGNNFMCASAIIAFLHGSDPRDVEETKVEETKGVEETERKRREKLEPLVKLWEEQEILREKLGMLEQAELREELLKVREEQKEHEHRKKRLEKIVQYLNERQHVPDEKPITLVYDFYDHLLKCPTKPSHANRSDKEPSFEKAKWIMGFYLLPFGFGGWTRNGTPLLILANILGFTLNDVTSYLLPFRPLISIPVGENAYEHPLRFLHTSFIDYLRDPKTHPSIRIDARDVELHLWACHFRHLKKFSDLGLEPRELAIIDNDHNPKTLHPEFKKFKKEFESGFKKQFFESAQRVFLGIRSSPVAQTNAYSRLDDLTPELRNTLTDVFKEVNFGELAGKYRHPDASASLAHFLKTLCNPSSAVTLRRIFEGANLVSKQQLSDFNLNFDWLRKDKISFSIDDSDVHTITFYRPEKTWKLPEWISSFFKKPKVTDSEVVIVGSIEAGQCLLWFDEHKKAYCVLPYAASNRSSGSPVQNTEPGERSYQK
ncbi:hypothetical protein AN958_05295 [Leucoagaricus sp. SymC.cos]|nr:hypothetical protein AN958_05295 [Leucoagaricus sp. SymC.cos]